MEIVKLDKDFVQESINSFIHLGRNVPLDDWVASNYLLDLSHKWDWSFCLINDTEICAFLIASLKSDFYYINRLVVSANMQNEGLGNKLLEKAKEVALKEMMKGIRLKVHIDNESAFSWYQKKSFKVVLLENNHYLMELSLK